jgi:hypothetical protein
MASCFWRKPFGHGTSTVNVSPQLTRDTVEHVVAETNLRTYTVSGGDLQELSNELVKSPASIRSRLLAQSYMCPDETP